MEEMFEDGVEMPAEEDPKKLGKAGIMTWKVSAFFDNIRMHPTTDISPELP